MPKTGALITGSRPLVMGGGRSRPLSRRQAGQVKKMILSNKQVKQNFLSVDNTITDTGTLQELTSIVTGDDFNQRVSDRINVLSARVHVSISPSSDDAFDEQTNRIMVVRSKRSQLAVADLPSIFQLPDLDKFQVLLDRYISWSGNTAQSQITIDFFNSFKRGKIPHMKIIYDDDISALAAQKNPIYLFYISSNPVVNSGTDIEGYLLTKWLDAI